MEPNWTKKISSETVCNFFYAFFVIYVVFAVISLFGLVSLFAFSAKMPKGVLITQGIYALVTLGLATTMALFHYLICDRALKPGVKQGFEDKEKTEQEAEDEIY
jgi:hypothetical protein